MALNFYIHIMLGLDNYYFWLVYFRKCYINISLAFWNLQVTHIQSIYNHGILIFCVWLVELKSHQPCASYIGVNTCRINMLFRDVKYLDYDYLRSRIQ